MLGRTGIYQVSSSENITQNSILSDDEDFTDDGDHHNFRNPGLATLRRARFKDTADDISGSEGESEGFLDTPVNELSPKAHRVTLQTDDPQDSADEEETASEGGESTEELSQDQEEQGGDSEEESSSDDDNSAENLRRKYEETKQKARTFKKMCKTLLSYRQMMEGEIEKISGKLSAQEKDLQEEKSLKSAALEKLNNVQNLYEELERETQGIEEAYEQKCNEWD